MQMRFASLVSVLLAAASLDACSLPPSTYSAGPVFGTVMDAETRQPIAGAVVVAQWILQGGLEFHGVGVLTARETTTDSSGKFRIDPWGPLPRPREGVLDAQDPELLVFKPGYQAALLVNYYDAPKERVSLQMREFLPNGSVIELKRYAGEKNRDFTAGAVRGTLQQSARRSGCNWKDIPRAIKAVDVELRALGQSGNVIGRELLVRSDCGSLDDFKKAYEEFGT